MVYTLHYASHSLARRAGHTSQASSLPVRSSFTYRNFRLHSAEHMHLIGVTAQTCLDNLRVNTWKAVKNPKRTSVRKICHPTFSHYIHLSLAWAALLVTPSWPPRAQELLRDEHWKYPHKKFSNALSTMHSKIHGRRILKRFCVKQVVALGTYTLKEW